MSEFKTAKLQNADSVEYTAPRPIKPTGILHFTISVSDIERARKFYEEVIGATYWRQNKTTVFMCVGEQFFVLSNIGYHRPPNNAGHTLIHNAFIVDGEAFGSAMSYLESRGVEILNYEDTGHNSFAGRHAYFQDPDGNAVEIIDLQGWGRAGAPPNRAG